MKVTRDVIYDLLPAYFANEVSADARVLVEEFLATDPEFARMAARFQSLLDERHRQPAVDTETEEARQRARFDRARLETQLRAKARTSAVVWALAAAFGWFIAFVTWNEGMGWLNPGVLLGASFLLGALVTFAASFVVTPDSPWRAAVGLDDDTLRSLGGWTIGRNSSSDEPSKRRDN